jgi:hypothetical protein
MASNDTGVTMGFRAVAVPYVPVGGAIGCGSPMLALPRSTPVGPSDRVRAPGLTR